MSAASIGLAMSMAGATLAAADDPVGSPTPSGTASVSSSPSPTVSSDPSVTPTSAESPSPSAVTTAEVTVSPTPVPSGTLTPAKQQSPSRGVQDAQVAAAAGRVSGVLRDATTGAPIRNSCVAIRPSNVTFTATNGTMGVSEKGTWAFDLPDPSPVYLAFYVTADGDCSHAVLTGSGNYRASWYRAQPFTGTNPSTALPPPGADLVAGGSTIVACLATHDALPTTCTTPNRTASGRVVGVGNVPIRNACIVAFGPDNMLADVVATGADGRWTLTGLPINYDYIVGAIPPFHSSRGPCSENADGPPPVPAPGGLQPEFYDDTWADLAELNQRDDAYAWATDPNSPHPAVTLRNNQSGIDFCLTTETGRATERGSCDPVAATPAPYGTASPSARSTLPATGGPSLPIQALGAALLLAGLALLIRSRPIGRRATARADINQSSGPPPQP